MRVRSADGELKTIGLYEITKARPDPGPGVDCSDQCLYQVMNGQSNRL